MKKKLLYGSVTALFTLSSAAISAEFSPASVRALGMGGSNVASTNGVNASYWNPAAYGFFGESDASAEAKAVDNNAMSDKDFGLQLEIGAGAYIYGPLEANRVIAQNLPTSVLGATGTFSATQIKDAAAFVNGLSSLDSAPQGANLFANATLGARVSNYGIGLRVSGDFNNSLAIDNQNVGLNVASSFAGNATLGALPPTTYFSGAQASALVTSLTGPAGAGLTVGQANAVVAAYDAALALDPTVAGQQQQMIDALNTISGNNGDLTQNATSLSSRGVVLSEVGFTYGHAINERLSVGTVIKALQAKIIVRDVNIVGKNPNFGTFNRNSVETLTGAGLDLGVMYRLPDWQFGLTARNVNAPSFQHSSGYIYKLKPQAKAGVAWIPSDTFTMEAALDLTENQGAVPNSLSRYWNAGLEWDAWKVLAIRLGAFQNMSEKNIGVVPTLGLGLNLWAMRVDLSAARSTKKVIFDGKSVPAYGIAALAVAVDF